MRERDRGLPEALSGEKKPAAQALRDSMRGIARAGLRAPEKHHLRKLEQEGAHAADSPIEAAERLRGLSSELKLLERARELAAEW